MILNETQYRRNDAIKTTSETVKLNTPERSSSSFTFVYLDNATLSGVLGACIELKYPGEQDFTRTVIAHMEMGGMYPFHIVDLKLVEGINIVRVTYLGGPCSWGGKIRLSITSEPLYLIVTKDSTGKITVEDFE